MSIAASMIGIISLWFQSFSDSIWVVSEPSYSNDYSMAAIILFVVLIRIASMILSKVDDIMGFKQFLFSWYKNGNWNV